MSLISKNSTLFSMMLTEHLNEKPKRYKIERYEIDSMKRYSNYLSMKQESRYLLDDNHMYKIYLFEKRNEGRKACTYASILMHFAMRYESVDNIDSFLESLNVKAMTSWSLMAMLRYTYIYRHRMSQWEKLYNVTYKQIEKEGLNPRKELYGLDA